MKHRPTFKKQIDIPEGLHIRIANARGYMSANAYIIGILEKHVPMGCLASHVPSYPGLVPSQGGSPIEGGSAIPAPPPPPPPVIPRRPVCGPFSGHDHLREQEDWDMQYGDEAAKADAIRRRPIREAREIEEKKVLAAKQEAHRKAKAEREAEERALFAEEDAQMARDREARLGMQKDEEWA